MNCKVLSSDLLKFISVVKGEQSDWIALAGFGHKTELKEKRLEEILDILTLLLAEIKK